jgi:hypothetical protein
MVCLCCSTELSRQLLLTRFSLALLPCHAQTRRTWTSLLAPPTCARSISASRSGGLPAGLTWSLARPADSFRFSPRPKTAHDVHVPRSPPLLPPGRQIFSDPLRTFRVAQAETDEKVILDLLSKVKVPDFVPDKSVKVRSKHMHWFLCVSTLQMRSAHFHVRCGSCCRSAASTSCSRTRATRAIRQHNLAA